MKVWLPRMVVAQVDERSGQMARSEWLRRLIENAMAGGDVNELVVSMGNAVGLTDRVEMMQRALGAREPSVAVTRPWHVFVPLASSPLRCQVCGHGSGQGWHR